MDSCPHGERIAGMEQRLKSGDGILEKLESQMEKLIANVAELLHCVKGDNGLLETQKKHTEIVGRLDNLDTIDKVEKHHVWYVLGTFIISFFGIATLASIIYMGKLVSKFSGLLP